jgi:hypothetical protein
MPDQIDLAETIAKAIRQALARGIVQGDGSFVRMDDEAVSVLADSIAAALDEQATARRTRREAP